MTARASLVAGMLALAVAGLTATVAGGAVRAVNIKADVHMLPGSGATLLQGGTFSGPPLGRGSVRVRTKVGDGRGATLRFTFTTSRGTVSGTGDVAVTFRGTRVSYRGTASIRSGTGAFRGWHSRRLKLSGDGDLDTGFRVSLTGRVAGR